MLHQNKGRKLNVTSKHRKALLRNLAGHFIKYGKLCSTVARIKEVRSFIERIVTLARRGQDFNNIRKIRSILPYDINIVNKLIKDIAPQYIGRNGGYTRIVRLHNRIKDTAEVGCLLWVKGQQAELPKDESVNKTINTTTENNESEKVSEK